MCTRKYMFGDKSTYGSRNKSPKKVNKKKYFVYI